MNWKSLGGTVLVLAFIGVLAYGAIWGSDEIDSQVDRVEESIVERFGDETWDLKDAACPRFDALEDGEKTTCTATATDANGTTAPATVVVTLEDCHEVGDRDTGSVVCDFHSRWAVE